MRGFLTSVYSGDNYSHLSLTADGKFFKKDFKNGCPIVDFYEYKRYIFSDDCELTSIGHSSSIDHIAHDFEHITWRSCLSDDFTKHEDLTQIKLYNAADLLDIFSSVGEMSYDELLCHVDHKTFWDYRNYCIENLKNK